MLREEISLVVRFGEGRCSGVIGKGLARTSWAWPSVSISSVSSLVDILVAGRSITDCAGVTYVDDLSETASWSGKARSGRLGLLSPLLGVLPPLQLRLDIRRNMPVNGDTPGPPRPALPLRGGMTDAEGVTYRAKVAIARNTPRADLHILKRGRSWPVPHHQPSSEGELTVKYL